MQRKTCSFEHEQRDVMFLNVRIGMQGATLKSSHIESFLESKKVCQDAYKTWK